MRRRGVRFAPLPPLHNTSAPMRTLIYRLAALLMAAFALCGPAAAYMLFDDFAHVYNVTLVSGSGQWLGNRIAVGPNPVTVEEVKINVASRSGAGRLDMQVCEEGSNTTPVNCEPFAMDQLSYGERTFTGTFTAAANSNLWVILRPEVGVPSDYTIALAADDNFGLFSENGGTTWRTGASTVSMRVRGVVAMPPTVVGIAPAEGPTAGGTPVVISGSQLSDVRAVRFGGQNAASFTAESDTRLVATTPAGPAGLAVVELVNDFGTAASATSFNYVNRAAPSIASVQPAQGPASGGTQVVIHGADFDSVTAVRFGGTAVGFTANGSQITAITPAMAPGPVAVEVATPFGTATGSFSALGAPTLSNVSPGYGTQAGGTLVTITGSGLATTTGVTFGGTSANSVTVVNDGQITAVTPASTGASVVPMVVTTLGGTSNPVIFEYTAVPVLDSISPAQVSVAGGTTVTLNGQNLAGASVSVDGMGISWISRTATQITFTAPARSAGSSEVRVTSLGGSSQPLVLTYVGPPSVSGVQPAAGPVAGGTAVLVYGQGFLGTSSVAFGGTPAPQFTVVSDTLIDAVAPAHAAGAVSLVVTTVGGTGNVGYTYNYPQPTVSGFAPQTGPVPGGTAVTITGTGFTGALGVRFGGTLAPSMTVRSDTQITATTPAGTSGNAVVSVVTPGGQADASARFTYVTIPTLTAVQPSSGPVTGGTQVLLSGSGFTGAAAVSFGGAPAPSFTVNGDSQITATAPAHAAGNAAVQVTTPGGVASGATFAYVAAPVITAVQPNRGPLAGGSTVLISGSGLSGVVDVRFGGTAAIGWTVLSDSQLNVTLPDHAAGAVPLEVVTHSGTAAGGTFTFAPPPAITGLAPDAGPAGQATPVVITGTGFTGAIVVGFGTALAPSFTVDSDTQITATTPGSQPPGSVPVKVATPAGSATSAMSYLFAPTPVVSAVTPLQGPATGSATVTLTGSGFTRATELRFGTVPAASFTVDSDTQITAVTPAHAAGTAALQVTTPGGSATGASYTFVQAAPTLASASPASAPPAGGTGVVLTGTGFVGVTSVTFGGTAAPSFTVNSATQITAVTPAHPAGPAAVQVTTADGTATLASGFVYADTPLAGACGAAAGQAALLAPSGAGLCSAGVASAVASADGEHAWTCAGTHGGADSPRCSAPWASAGGTGGRTALALPATGNNGWTLGEAAVQGSLPAPLPQGASSPYLPLQLTLAGGAAGSSARVTVHYSEPVPPGAVYYKHGPSPEGLNCTGATACAQPHWYPLPASAADFAADRRSVTLTLTDGGLGDSDTVPGQITDPGMPVLLAVEPGAGATPVPALGPWALAWLALALPALGGVARRKLRR